MRKRPVLVGELLVVVGLLFVYDQVAGLAKLREAAAITHGSDLLRVEHFGLELHADHLLGRLHLLQAPASLYYDFAHILVTMFVLLGAYVFRPERYRRSRNALVGINVVGLVTFFTWPVAPPRLLPGAGFTDIVGHSGTWGAYESVSTGVGTHANELASMPSLHAAWALWVALTVCAMTRRQWVRALGWTHVALTVVVVIATGNHYLLDVVAGFLTCGACWVVAPTLRRPTAAPAEPVLAHR